MRSMKLAAALLAATFASVSLNAAPKRTDLDGVWILLRAQTGTLRLTPAGEKAKAAYDFQKDDPDFQCKPASFTRIMHTPSPPIEVRQHSDFVEVNYEFMDVHRRVPLNAKLAPKDAPYAVKEQPHLGRSVGRFDGETLVVETAGQKAGIMDTLGVPGLYQSDQIHTTERFTADGNKMEIVVTHEDPVYLAQPLTVTFSYLRLPDGKIETWDCKPEEATFEKFIPAGDKK
jgi:hypothetical protein